MNLEEFTIAVQQICAKFAKIHSAATFIQATENGFLRDLYGIADGALIDVTLLPTPSAYAESVLLSLNPAIMILTQKRHLSELWKIAGEFSITPCAPAVFSHKGFTVKAPEGNVVIDDIGELFALGDFGVPYKIDNDDCMQRTDETIENNICSHDFSITNCTLTVKDIENTTIYEKLSELMKDKNAVYAVCGTVNVYDGNTIPMILALDAFRRNEEPGILYSRFFSGEKTTITVFKLTEKKI